MLDAGKIPFEKPGSHRKVSLEDEVEYKEVRRAEQYEALASMTVPEDETGSIVTDNIKYFPLDNLPNGIQIISAKDFAYETVAMRPDSGLAAVVAISQRTGRNHPRPSTEDILNSLDSIYGMNSATGLIRALLEPETGNER